MISKKLQIKTNALGRLIEQEKLYKVELEEQKQLVKSMQDSGADEYELKKQKEVLAESEKMIPVIQDKVRQFMEDLESYVKEHPEEDASLASKKLELAKQVLAK